jgi:peptidoglycan hydrolase-like protein with peptidoglycan-binding domain
MKKYVISLFILGLFFLGAGSAKAVSMNDLQNEIKSLGEQINSLKSQLVGLVLSSRTATVEAPVPTVAPTTTVLTKGIKSTEVAEVQTALRNQGYTIVADGSFGAKTEAAVKAFQVAKSLPVTGKVDSMTKSKLALTNEIKSQSQLTLVPEFPSNYIARNCKSSYEISGISVQVGSPKIVETGETEQASLVLNVDWDDKEAQKRNSLVPSFYNVLVVNSNKNVVQETQIPAVARKVHYSISIPFDGIKKVLGENYDIIVEAIYNNVCITSESSNKIHIPTTSAGSIVLINPGNNNKDLILNQTYSWTRTIEFSGELNDETSFEVSYTIPPAKYTTTGSSPTTYYLGAPKTYTSGNKRIFDCSVAKKTCSVTISGTLTYEEAVAVINGNKYNPSTGQFLLDVNGQKIPHNQINIKVKKINKFSGLVVSDGGDYSFKD